MALEAHRIDSFGFKHQPVTTAMPCVAVFAFVFFHGPMLIPAFITIRMAAYTKILLPFKTELMLTGLNVTESAVIPDRCM